ncbi:MAG: autotransporter-associated beta strand repeat-containing protein [Verrucomicrobia bacterium]|nr:autotransporter-associated beta strand repeat-containing protein [Verrucomicrobiota bacterium]
MKPKSFVPHLALCSVIVLTAGVHAASVTKSAAGTDLADGTSWSGSAPTATDTATWNASSLGAGLTLGSNASWQGIAITGATSDVDITGSGTLTLGSAGIDMASSTVNLSISNNIALDASQTWKAAPGKTITASGVISGSAGLTLGALAQSVTSTTFLTTTAQPLFTNTSLASVTATSGKMGGGWVNSGTPVNGTGYLLSNNGTTATYWLEALDGGFTKGVKIQLDQVGSDITAKVFSSGGVKYVSGSSLGYNFNTGGTAGTLATSQAGNGYGAHTTTLKLGNDSTGTVFLSGVNTYTGPTSVTTGILRAGVASVAGVGGAFGNNSALSIANAANAGIELNGFSTQVGSITGGGTTGGNLSLGSATLTVGGDNTSPAAYAGVISGTGGLTKIGSGTQVLGGNNTYAGGTTVNGTGTLTGTAGVVYTGTQGGSFGTGEITVTSGATIKSSGFFVIGGGQTTTRALNLLGGTANLQGAGTGGEYIKTLNLTGGAVTFDSGSVYFRAPNGGTTISTAAAAVSSTIATGIDLTLGNLTITTAAGTVPNGQDLVISGNISQNSGAGAGAKSLTKSGDGTLVIAGASNSYTGNTTVNAGTLVVSGTLAAATGTVDIAANATLSGTGTINRPVNLATDSNLTPAGSDIGTLTVGGAVTMLGKTVCQIHKDTTPTLTGDLLAAQTIAFGGTLEVTASGEPITLGDTFDLFDATNFTGSFTSLNLPTLAEGLSWDLSNLAVDGTITVVDFVTTPVFSLTPGGYQGTPSVTLTTQDGATIHYTLDGSPPTAASPVYTDPLTLPANTTNFTINCFARKTGQADSPVATAVYNTIDTPTWITNADGYWSNQSGDEANWQNSVIAGGTDGIADFSTLPLEQNTTVTLDGSRSIGALVFGDASADPAFDWLLSPSGNSTLTLAKTIGTPSITVNNQTATIGVQMLGNQGLAKSGPGTLKLTGVCAYTGDTTVNGGALTLVSSAAPSQAAQLASGKIANAGTVTFYRGAAGFTPVTASLSGSGDFFVDGPGGGGLYDNRLAFRGTASDNTGTIHIINHGRLWVDATGVNSIGDSAVVNIGPTASFHIYKSVAETIGGLDGSGEVWGQDAAGFTATLIVGGGDRTASFTGAVKENLTKLAITKTGTGTQTLGGINSYTGATTVEGGTLAGSGAAGSDFTVKVGATLAPGGSIGTMETKALTFESGSTLQVEIDSTSGTADKVVAHGDVTLTGATATFAEAGAGIFAPGTKLVVLDYTGHTLSGTFSGLAEGASVAVGSNTFTIHYADNSRITLSIPAGYSSWAETNAPGETMGDDHDQDGVANGIEYFMGLSGSGFTGNPGLDATGLISWQKGNDYTGTYGTDYVVQTSADLSTWDDVPVGQVTIAADRVDYTLPKVDPRRFVRLVVTGP